MRPTAPAWHDAVNAGKESVVCDLKTEAGWRSRTRSARGPTPFWTASAPGVLDRLGVVVPETAVLCAVTGFGVGNRHEHRAGHDVNYLGWAGVLADTAPAMPPTQIADLAAGGLSAALEVAAALLARERTGRGARIVVSMTHGSHRLRRAPARGPARAAADRRRRLLPDLRDRGRALADRRRPRAEVLAAAVRGRRAAGARRAPVRPRPGSGRGRARRGDRCATARRVARADGRRGRLRQAQSGRSRRRRRNSAATPTGERRIWASTRRHGALSSTSSRLGHVRV